MTRYKQVYLRRGKEESLLRFHPWIFSGAIHHTDDGVQEGDIVRVISTEGTPMAVGHYQQGSIAVRVLSFADVPIDAAFWQQRLRSALTLRQALLLADSPQGNAYRLVHGEGDALPGLIIDVYGPTAVMQAHSIGMHRCRHDIAQALLKVMDGRIANVYYKSETTLPFIETAAGFICGSSTDDTAVNDFVRNQEQFKSQSRNHRADTQLNVFLHVGRKVVALNFFVAQMESPHENYKRPLDFAQRNL